MLKISISGVRGYAFKSLTEEVIFSFASAFASYIKSGAVVLGRDTRVSGKKIKKIVIKALTGHGIKVYDLGIVPTPTVGIMTKKLKARGGIVITASHNPLPWNGLKFFGSDGIFLTPQEFKKLEKIYDNKI
ncbi:hypothetical protein ACFL52_00335 [Candidatus Margulisiibacteriota bacterium]